MARAVLVNPRVTAIDSTVALTPRDALAGGLGALVTRVAARMDGEGVLLLDRASTALLGLPGASDGDLWAGPYVLDQHPVTDSLRAAGWATSAIKDWFTVTGRPGQPLVHIGILPWIDHGRPPAWGDWPTDRTALLSLWHSLTGSSYLMTPGVAGLQVLRASLVGSRFKVAWKQEDRVDAAELVYRAEDWVNCAHPGDQLCPDCAVKTWTYDARSAGHAAAGSAEVSPWALKHTGRVKFDRGLSGWWQVEVPPWNDPRMPDPVGPTREPVMWLTTPTVALLEDLAEEGVSRGVSWTALDSWTNNSRRVLRPWSDRMRDAMVEARRLAGSPDPVVARDGEVIAGWVKQAAARETPGMLGAGTGSVQRSDWHHTITAVKRTNIWRRAWRIGQRHGLWPLRIDDDRISYRAPAPTVPAAQAATVPAADRGAVFVLGDGLGQWREEVRG